ncbi:hypothetical protein Esi_0139_0028 [Ectocarpus siliculosus]|uniref:Uncharacterized protein n=1 Tax=Ectocarpus siliculosus TaxID=2880 RepID=D7FK02_ECTSI|nr:hypothetical protein Esi_0139_0028 [Ectocarpus siliculosus]|eukprot:CBJ49091.1 hypothetical protein Esi_0139_0028 [Ectocarpus siliculosus]
MMDAGVEELDLQGDEETKKLSTVPCARLLQWRPPCSKAEPLL